MNSNQTLKVCYFGTYRENYSRNQIMIAGLREVGVEVIECQETLWRDIDDRIQLASGGWIKFSFAGRLSRTYFQLFRKYSEIKDYDILVIGYPGQLDVFFGWFLSRIKNRPLVWDVFMSIYLISLERGLNKASRLSVRLINIIEWIGLRLPDRDIIDTNQYAAWLQQTYGISREKIDLVPTGADNRIFHIEHTPPQNNTFSILYYGSFIANHNVPLIIETARILSTNRNIHFTFVGDGPDRIKSEQLAKSYLLNNSTFIDWLDKKALVQKISQADICLGAFGHTPQSLMTVQNKIYECMSMGKVVITGNSETIRSNFRHKEHIYICERDPDSLAAAIDDLYHNERLCKDIARSGHEQYLSNYTIEKIGETFKNHLCHILLSKNENN
jgi:glycosyltransferase involved in cell wall biosynthesis